MVRVSCDGRVWIPRCCVSGVEVDCLEKLWKLELNLLWVGFKSPILLPLCVWWRGVVDDLMF